MADIGVLVCVSVVGAVVLIGYFSTKTKGFGRFSTSALVILASLVLTAVLFSAGKLDVDVFSNVVFAVIGFAGGLVVGKVADAKGAD